MAALKPDGDTKGMANTNSPKARNCSRCKGTGEARFNHMNGDTHCYLCDGTGVQVTYSAEAKARQDAERQWGSDAHFRLVGGFHSYENQIRRPVREATGEMSRHNNPLTRRLTWWVSEGLAEMIEAQGEERREAEAKAVREFKEARA
jgi:hypothetical protein